MTVAAVLFAIAALGGVIIAGMRLRGRQLPPLGLALVHGAFAAGGLIAFLVVVVGRATSTQAVVALVGFIIAALGGFFLFSYHLRRHALPVPVVIVHGLIAVISFIILLIAIFAAAT